MRRPLVATLDLLRLKAPLQHAVGALRRFGIDCVAARIDDELPHDPGAFTQGLAYQRGVLYESTGLVGASSLRCLDPQSGRITRHIRVPGVWAEGITIVDERLFQLTWKDGLALTYDLPELEAGARLAYPGEGWGLTHDGSLLLTSDGSDTLCYRGADLSPIQTLPVRLNGLALRGLNDLELVHDTIWANVLHDDHIYGIDPGSGNVTRIISCAHLRERARLPERAYPLNGIAYDPDREALLVTGKNWPLLFRIELPPSASR